MSTISKKICLIGDFSVGKTSLIRRFVERQFSDQYLSTVGVKISRKTVELELANEPKSQSVQLLIWDIEGSTKFKAIAPTYLQGCSGAIIVADVTRQDTIDHFSEHITLFLSINPKALFCLALNKSDLIDPDKLDKLTKSINCPNIDKLVQIYQTSAKTGKDVDEMFSELSSKIIFST